jgi:transposase
MPCPPTPQRDLIAPFMPDSSGKSGRSFKDHRLRTEGIIYRSRAGIPWGDFPEHFGSWKTVWKRHRRYSRDGTWDRVLAALLTVRMPPC